MKRLSIFLGAAGLFGAGFWLGLSTPAAPAPVAESPAQSDGKSAIPKAFQREARAAAPLPTSARDWKRLLAEVEPDEVPALLRSASALNDKNLRAFVLSRLLAIWASEEPEAALTWVSQINDRSWLDLRGVFEAWAEQDPVAAAARVPGMAPPFTAHQAAAAVADSWCRRDLAAATAWAGTLQDPSLRSNAFAAILRSLAETDPAQAVALALSLDQPANSTGQLWNVVMTQALSDPGAALTTINNLPTGVPRDALFRNIVYMLSEEDPKAAGEFALTLPAGKYQTDALRMIALHLVAEAPQSALDWIATQLPIGPVRSSLFKDALITFAKSDPAAAVPYLDQVCGNDRRNVAINLASHWVRLDPQAATAWASQLPADPIRTHILQSLADSWADDDPSAALAFSLRETDADNRTSMLHAVASSWPTAALTDARATLDQLPSDEVRKAFVTGLVQGSARRDHTTVARWVASLPAGALHDSAAAAYVFNAAYQDPPLAIQVASSITANSARQDALSTIARVWLHNDRAAATAWLATADLPEATKQKLLARGP